MKNSIGKNFNFLWVALIISYICTIFFWNFMDITNIISESEDDSDNEIEQQENNTTIPVTDCFGETVDIDDADFVHEYSFSKSLKEHDVEINSVNFKYRNSPEWIFDNLNLKIKKNSHTVITGQNGSGKSTLLGLISGMLIHQNGSIKIGRDKLGYIGPTPLILSTSLKENLLYGNTAVVDESNILETCEMFKLFDVVNKEILDRQVTNTSLSSGQMQKVGFIRAILSNVEILLLDESTSNLDRNTKSLILDILTNKNITVINSTHDPTSFKQIDRHIQIDIVDNKRLIYDI